MPQFNVHVYAIVRVKYENVEAESMEAAVVKARESNWGDLNQRFESWGDTQTDFSEEISHYLVDEADDEDFYYSRWFGDRDHYATVLNDTKHQRSTV